MARSRSCSARCEGSVGAFLTDVPPPSSCRAADAAASVKAEMGSHWANMPRYSSPELGKKHVLCNHCVCELYPRVRFVYVSATFETSLTCNTLLKPTQRTRSPCNAHHSVFSQPPLIVHPHRVPRDPQTCARRRVQVSSLLLSLSHGTPTTRVIPRGMCEMIAPRVSCGRPGSKARSQ